MDEKTKNLVQNYVQMWENMTAPIRPMEDGLEVYRARIEQSSGRRILILGTTPELVDLAVELGAKTIISIERYPFVVEAMRQMAKKDWGDVQIIVGDWLEDRPEFHSAFDCILCDGGLLFLDFPHIWEQLFTRIRPYLAQGGVFLSKGYTEPPGEWDFELLYQDHRRAFEATVRANRSINYLDAFRRYMSELLSIAYIDGIRRDDGSFNQLVASHRLDRLISELEKAYPSEEEKIVIESALKHLVRSESDFTGIVVGIRFEDAEALLQDIGFTCEYIPLSFPPVPGAYYMLCARMTEDHD